MKLKMGMALVFVGTLVLLYHFQVLDCLSSTWFEEHILGMRQFVLGHYIVAVLAYVLAYASATALSIPGTFFFITVGGLLFGVLPGIVYANMGITMGSTLLFLLSRYVFGCALQRAYAHRLQRFNAEMDEHGYYYLVLFRAAALLPTFLINLFSGLTVVPVTTFIWTTALGVIPISLCYTLAGNELGHMHAWADIYSVRGIIVLILFLVPKLVLVPLLVRRIRQRKRLVQSVMPEMIYTECPTISCTER